MRTEIPDLKEQGGISDERDSGSNSPTNVETLCLTPGKSGHSSTTSNVKGSEAVSGDARLLAKFTLQNLLPRSIGVLLVVAAVLVFVAVTAALVTTKSEQLSGLPVSDSVLRIRTGYVAAFAAGRTSQAWLPDRWFRGGTSVVVPDGRESSDDQLRGVQFERQGSFDYDIPLENGVYELRLYFASPRHVRRFSVFANGTLLLGSLNPSVRLGDTNDLDVRVFRGIGAASDGKLHLSFRPGTGPASVSGIELTRGERGHLKPLRMIVAKDPYTSLDGEIWGAERFVTGGTRVERYDVIKGRFDPHLFASERWGVFSYAIPLAPSRYGVTLYFAETWFGPGRIAGGGVGSRRFDVFQNGKLLLEDFDIYRTAGGNDRGIAETFHGLEPGTDGYLTLDFVPRVNFACINAIEVVEETN
jgi:hypothetical protein